LEIRRPARECNSGSREDFQRQLEKKKKKKKKKESSEELVIVPWTKPEEQVTASRDGFKLLTKAVVINRASNYRGIAY